MAFEKGNMVKFYIVCCQEMAHYIDIAGDRYNLTGYQEIGLQAKARQMFNSAWGVDNQKLLSQLFPWPYNQEKTLATISKLSEPVQQLVVKLIESRIKQIKEQQNLNRNSLVSVQGRRIMGNLQTLLGRIADSKANKDSREREEADEDGIEGLTADEQFEMIFRLAWVLLHPGDMGANTKEKFDQVVSDIKKMRVMDLVKSIRDVGEAEGLRDKVAMNYFKRLDFSEPLKEKELGNALVKAKEAILADHQGKIENMLKNRLKLIMQIFAVHKYIEPDVLNRVQKSINSVGVGVGADGGTGIATDLDNTIADISGQLLDKIKYSLEPLRRFYRQTYDPIYSILEKELGDNIGGLDDLVRIYGIMQTVAESGDVGRIIRINGAPKSIQTILRLYADIYNKGLKDKSELMKLESDGYRGTAVKLISGTSIRVFTENDLQERKRVLTERKDVSGTEVFKTLDLAKVVEAAGKYFDPSSVFIIAYSQKSIKSISEVPCNLYEIKWSDASGALQPAENYLVEIQKKISKTFSKIRIADIAQVYSSYCGMSTLALIVQIIFINSLGSYRAPK